MKKHLLSALMGLLALCHLPTPALAQCAIQTEGVNRQSADDLTIKVVGNCTHDCQQITVHWINPVLPDKTFSVNNNPNDLSVPNTWSVEYTSADGLTLSMLLNNFACGSTNYSFQASCADIPNCQMTIPVGGLAVACKHQDAICTIQDVDLHCGDNGRLTAETSVSSTGGESVSVTLTVTRDGQNVANRSLSDNDGFVTVSRDFDFAPGTYIVTASITAPPSCIQTLASTFTIDPGACTGGSPTPDDETTTPPPPCSTCELCGGDWTCCLAWVGVFVGLLVLVATIMYLICDPSGGGGWGWLILLIAAIVFGFALWWVIVHCQFDLCRLLQIIVGAFTIDLTLVCAIEGLFPCFSALICGVTVIAGQAIRNWFIILMVGMLLVFGIQVVCPLLH